MMRSPTTVNPDEDYVTAPGLPAYRPVTGSVGFYAGMLQCAGCFGAAAVSHVAPARRRVRLHTTFRVRRRVLMFGVPGWTGELFPAWILHLLTLWPACRIGA